MGRQRLRPALQHARRRVSRIPAELPPEADPAFVMLVKTDNAGSTASNQISLPLTGTYTIDWGDGVVEELSGTQGHTYSSAGEYTIRITGGLTRISFSGTVDRLKLLDIQNWGDIAWTTMADAFWGCANLVGTATDAPDLSGVTTLKQMFFQATNFNMDCSGWDVSTVTDFSDMFESAHSFNQDIGGWNTSNATTLHSMFRDAISFNQDIGGWNVAKAFSITWVFNGALAFNQNLGGWDMSGTQHMTGMFQNVTLSPANYGALLIGWAAQTLLTGVSFHGGNSKYPTDGTGNPATDAAAARAKIIADFGWTITDGGQV